MDVVLWILQGLMAIAFILAGVNYGFRYEAVKDMYKWMTDVSRGMLTFIGIAEILGGIGLVLPALTHILPS